jgi:hypothetical protein
LAGGELLAFGEGSLVGRRQALLEATGLGTDVCDLIECGSFGIELGSQAGRFDDEGGGGFSSFSEKGITAPGAAQKTAVGGVVGNFFPERLFKETRRYRYV